MKERAKCLLMIAGFLLCYNMPTASLPFKGPFYEALSLLKEYAREHVVFCLIPSFFIAGAVAVFVNKAGVIKYFGPQAKKVLSYSVAAVSGAVLAVCSCTVLPLFSSIYKRGAGLGPAVAFLYSGPAINVLAIVITARILGFELGLARFLGAVTFSVVIGFLMHLVFLKDEKKRHENGDFGFQNEESLRSLWKMTLFFACMVGILVFANWTNSQRGPFLWQRIFRIKWHLVGVLGGFLGFMIKRWFDIEELKTWIAQTWCFAKQIMPLLFLGVFVAGLLLGRPSHEGLISSSWIGGLVGGNTPLANFFASIAAVFMYFATLTEVPILHGLMGSGMGKGPALALLLAGPALSLPSMFVIRSVMGLKKTVVYVGLVVLMASLSGMLFGGLRG